MDHSHRPPADFSLDLVASDRPHVGNIGFAVARAIGGDGGTLASARLPF
jgi:hypothetical protein